MASPDGGTNLDTLVVGPKVEQAPRELRSIIAVDGLWCGASQHDPIQRPYYILASKPATDFNGQRFTSEHVKYC